MDWKQKWINKILTGIPAGNYRQRIEAELRDHLETQYLALLDSGRTKSEAQAEAISIMGAPDELKEEYRASWRRSRPGRMEALACCLKTCAKGYGVVFGVHSLISSIKSRIWMWAISLPGDSNIPRVKLIRSTLGNLNNSFFWFLFPLIIALVVGAYYMSRKLRAVRHPVLQISAVLCIRCAFIASLDIWFEALDDHMTFFEELIHMAPWFYLVIFALCILLGYVFKHLSAKPEKPSIE